MDARPRFRKQFLLPRYWLTWAGLGAVWVVVQLPYRWQLVVGAAAGRLLMALPGKRRRVAQINIGLCLPELSEAERRALVTRTFESVGISILETAIAWWWPKRRLRRLGAVEGLEHLRRLQGQGVILLAMHFTTLEIGAGLLGEHIPIDGMYRHHKNAVFDYVQRRGRERHNETSVAIVREDVRGMVDRLRGGHTIWFAPDQDYGIKHGVFAPLFGVCAATLTTTSKLARYGKAVVVPFTQTRLPGGRGYRLEIHPPLEQFPSTDPARDAVRLNRLVEEQVRRRPDQYLWLHRRFKTRPPGEASLYGTAERARKLRGATVGAAQPDHDAPDWSLPLNR
ncbi:MAG: LpxL/LpxP family Kdo(2)-lipid IV(A) lauroyl/palmitoleoyl acyltransferase [Gammaproteobacteria bacterium]